MTVPHLPMPNYEINRAAAAPVLARMSSSATFTDINSNLTARSVPQLCNMHPFLVRDWGMTNKDLWDAGIGGRIQGWYPQELNKSDCYP